jgi:hypothetical protein
LCPCRPLRAQSPSPPAGPLLPKIRGQIAEFLNQGSLVHLSLLSQPTCVGLRYGHPCPPEPAFLDCTDPAPSRSGLLHPLALASRSSRAGFRLLAPYQLGRRSSRRGTCLSASGIGQTARWWYWNVYQLSIGGRPRGRPLGPTNPPRIVLAAEPSGFRWWGFLPHFSVTHSGIRTRPRSTAGLRCRFAARATLPYQWRILHHS